MAFKSISLAATALVLSTSVNAALIERLGGLAYYDDVADLTWLADANYASTTGYDVDGWMTWAEANTWAETLEVSGVTGWRLPDSDSCQEYNCTGSEMGNLFYNVLGGSAGSSITSIHNANYDSFSNLIEYSYWLATSTEYYPNDVSGLFQLEDGRQSNTYRSVRLLAWAVQSGDIGASVVPVPTAVWLFGSGLIGLIGFARRKA